MTVTVIVQARMGSTRLPGKVLRPLAGRPMLALMLERLAPVHAGALVVATSDLERDDPIAAECARLGVACVRGSEHDVLDRFAAASRAHRADHVVRLTADCPLLDATLVDEVVATHLRRGADYTSNTLLRTYPDGLDVEVLTADALARAVRDATDPAEREHVTPHVVRRPERFRLAAHLGPRDLEDERWTVDTADDFAFVEEVLASTADPVRATWPDLLARIGVRRAAAPHALVLHVDRTVAPDPGHRRWVVRRGEAGPVLGTVQVDVVDGHGTCHVVDGPGGDALVDDPTFAAALDTRLRADLQVCTRSISHPSLTPYPKEDTDGRDLVLPR